MSKQHPFGLLKTCLGGMFFKAKQKCLLLLYEGLRKGEFIKPIDMINIQVSEILEYVINM